MGTESMTPRERWLAVLNHEHPDRVPLDYWATPEATDNLKRHLGCSSEKELFDALHIDAPIKVESRYVGPPLPENQDVFG